MNFHQARICNAEEHLSVSRIASVIKSAEFTFCIEALRLVPPQILGLWGTPGMLKSRDRSRDVSRPDFDGLGHGLGLEACSLGLASKHG